MAAQHMLSHHSRQRDKYGLPFVVKWEHVGIAGEVESVEGTRRKATRIAEHEKLFRSTETARRYVEKTVFMLNWSMPHLNLTDYPSTRLVAGAIIDSSNDKSLQEEVDLVKEIAEAASANEERLAHASTVFLEYAVSSISDRFSTAVFAEDLYRPPQGYLRVWGPKSHTKYDNRLGFLCSSWRTSRPAPNLEELKQRGTLSVTGLQSHCQKRHRPSDWISLSGDVSWMLKYINKHWPTNDVSTNSMRIALVSTAEMERLNVLFDRSDFLVQSAGGKLYSRANPQGVQFAWPSHYLAYGWIPAQCIVKIFTLRQFRDICEDRDIQPGQYTVVSVERSPNLVLIREIDRVFSVDPYTLLEDAQNASLGPMTQDLENLTV